MQWSYNDLENAPDDVVREIIEMMTEQAQQKGWA